MTVTISRDELKKKIKTRKTSDLLSSSKLCLPGYNQRFFYQQMIYAAKTSKIMHLKIMTHQKLFVRFSFLILIFILSAVGLIAQTGSSSKTENPILPNLTLSTIGGEQWSLHEQRGKIVLLNLWATWCAPCREEIPALVRLSKKYKPEELQIVGITLDSENIEIVNKFIKEFKMDYTILLTVPGSLLSRQETVPVTLLIDENSRLAKKYVGAADESLLEKDIKDLLNKKPAQNKADKNLKKN